MLRWRPKVKAEKTVNFPKLEEKEVRQLSIHEELQTAKEKLFEIYKIFCSKLVQYELSHNQHNNFAMVNVMLTNIVTDMIDGFKVERPATKSPEWKPIQERSDIYFIRCEMKKNIIDIPIHMENHTRIMGKKSLKQKEKMVEVKLAEQPERKEEIAEEKPAATREEEIIEMIPAGEPRARHLLETLINPFIMCFNNLNNPANCKAKECMQKYCNLLAPSSDGSCIDARTRTAFDYGMSQDLFTLTFTEMLENVVNDLSKQNKDDSFCYLIAFLMKKYWGYPFKKDTGDFGICKANGILGLDSQELIFNGLSSLYAKCTSDFLEAWHEVPNKLKGSYFTLICKKSDFFKTFNIHPLNFLEIHHLTCLMNESFQGMSLPSFISQKCREPEIAKQFVINALSHIHGITLSKADFWSDLSIFSLVNLETLPFNAFIVIMDNIDPKVLATCLEEQKFNPLDHPKIKNVTELEKTLKSIAPKLKSDFLYQLVSNTKTFPITPDSIDILKKYLDDFQMTQYILSILSMNPLSRWLYNESIDESKRAEKFMLILDVILTAAQKKLITNDNLLKMLLLDKLLVYKHFHTNFLGYFILRNSLDDSRLYHSILSKISSNMLINIFNVMGINKFSISIVLLDKMINNLESEDRLTIFKKYDFCIELPILTKKSIQRIFLGIIDKLPCIGIVELFNRVSALRQVFTHYGLYECSLKKLKNSPNKITILKKYYTFFNPLLKAPNVKNESIQSSMFFPSENKIHLSEQSQSTIAHHELDSSKQPVKKMGSNG